MTTEKQRTFGALVGMDSEVPVGAHRDDRVVFSDGTEGALVDAFTDCRGGAHRTEDDRDEADVAIVTEVLEKIDEWVVEYTTENEDYPAGAAHIVDETAHDWRDRFVEYVCERLEYHFDLDDVDTGDDIDEFRKSVADEVFERMDGGNDCEMEYCRNEYAAYSGDGFNPWSYDIGEYEEQVEISGHDELQALHDEGRLDDILDDVNCDVYVSRSKRRVKNEETGRYEGVGRDTYMPYEHDAKHPCLMTYHSPGGIWHYVFSAESVDQMIDDELERRADNDG